MYVIKTGVENETASLISRCVTIIQFLTACSKIEDGCSRNKATKTTLKNYCITVASLQAFPLSSF